MKQMQAREAKAKFSEMLDAASRGEATTITRHGTRIAMVVPIEKGDEIYSAEANRKFIEHLLAFPGPLEIEKDRRPPREIDL
jgi:prevent-host-death family protein